MNVSLPCSCGAAVAVKATDAGSEVACRCGRLVHVPLLTELRRLSGRGALEVSVIDTINRLIHEGALPAGHSCAVSGLPTDETYELYVEVERVWVKQGPTSGLAVLLFFLHPLAALIHMMADYGRGGGNSEVHGRQRGLNVPLHIRSECLPQLKKMSQRQLKNLLRTVPVYEQLLNEYRDARVAV